MENKFRSAEANPQFEGVFDVSPEEVQAQANSLTLIDVRQPEEYTGELGHVPGSKLIVLDQIPEKLNEIPRDKNIVFICRSGGRSARATAFALEQGFSQVFNMKGGMLLWNELGFETEATEK